MRSCSIAYVFDHISHGTAIPRHEQRDLPDEGDGRAALRAHGRRRGDNLIIIIIIVICSNIRICIIITLLPLLIIIITSIYYSDISNRYSNTLYY